MESDEFEKVLSRVAQLINQGNKSELLLRLGSESSIPLDKCPNVFAQDSISKGALVAEVVYFEITGRIRNRHRWYGNDED